MRRTSCAATHLKETRASNLTCYDASAQAVSLVSVQETRNAVGNPLALHSYDTRTPLCRVRVFIRGQKINSCKLNFSPQLQGSHPHAGDGPDQETRRGHRQRHGVHQGARTVHRVKPPPAPGGTSPPHRARCLPPVLFPERVVVVKQAVVVCIFFLFFRRGLGPLLRTGNSTPADD